MCIVSQVIYLKRSTGTSVALAKSAYINKRHNWIIYLRRGIASPGCMHQYSHYDIKCEDNQLASSPHGTLADHAEQSFRYSLMRNTPYWVCVWRCSYWTACYKGLEIWPLPTIYIPGLYKFKVTVVKSIWLEKELFLLAKTYMPFVHWMKAISIKFPGYRSKISEVIATPLLLKVSVVKGTKVKSSWL